MLLMLEDDTERIERFTAVLTHLDPTFEFGVWRDAWKMIREVELFLPRACLLSLDHDLEPEAGSLTDPGTGWDVTKVHAERLPSCPVILHTSNGERGTWKMEEFHLGGWEYHRSRRRLDRGTLAARRPQTAPTPAKLAPMTLPASGGIMSPCPPPAPRSNPDEP